MKSLKPLCLQGDAASINQFLLNLCAAYIDIDIVHLCTCQGFMPAPKTQFQLVGQQQPQMIPCVILTIMYKLPNNAEVDLLKFTTPQPGKETN